MVLTRDLYIEPGGDVLVNGVGGPLFTESGSCSMIIIPSSNFFEWVQG